MEKKLERILVVNTFGIGDVLFSTPMIATLRENLPDAHIDFICNKRTLEIARHNPRLNDIMVFEKDEYRNEFKKSKVGFIKKIKQFISSIRIKRYDIAIDLSLNYQISLLLFLAGVKRRIGFNYRNRGKFLTEKLEIDGFYKKHVAEYDLDLLRLIGLKKYSHPRLEFNLTEEEKGWAEEMIKSKNLEKKNLVGIAPGGGKSWGANAVYRTWKAKNFSFVGRELLKDKDYAILIFGSRDDLTLCGTVEKEVDGNVINLCGRLSIPESTSLIARCSVLLCNDSGILHVGVSQDVRTVSIFGPVDPDVYGPYPSSKRHKVIIAENASCRPCYRYFRHEACDHHTCLEGIKKERVLALVRESLKEK